MILSRNRSVQFWQKNLLVRCRNALPHPSSIYITLSNPTESTFNEFTSIFHPSEDRYRDREPCQEPVPHDQGEGPTVCPEKGVSKEAAAVRVARDDRWPVRPLGFYFRGRRNAASRKSAVGRGTSTTCPSCGRVAYTWPSLAFPGERGGEGGIQKPELPVAPVGIEKFQGPSPFPPPVHHNYGPPSTFHARTPSLGPPVFVPICRLRPPGNCH